MVGRILRMSDDPNLLGKRHTSALPRQSGMELESGTGWLSICPDGLSEEIRPPSPAVSLDVDVKSRKNEKPASRKKATQPIE